MPPAPLPFWDCTTAAPLARVSASLLIPPPSLADTGTEAPIPLPNVSSKILAKVIEYCKYHVDARKKTDADKPSKLDDDVKAWDMEFVKVDQGTLFELILVRGHLRLLPLLLLLLLLLHPDPFPPGQKAEIARLITPNAPCSCPDRRRRTTSTLRRSWTLPA